MRVNKAAYMTGLNKMEIREIEVPKPGFGQVLVKLEYVGICGSDIHYFHDGRCADYVVDGDFMLGHECAGVVVELGEGVDSLKPGDKVALEPGVTCGHCEFCKSGKYNLCPDVEFLGTPPIQGCYENYIAFPADMCFKLPENMNTKEGAMVEPLSVGLHAANLAEITIGDSVVVFGSGCIGLVTLLSCLARGATDVTVVDMIDKRLDYAKRLGASRVINSAKCDAVEEIMKITGGVGAAKVFDCSGAPACIEMTPFAVKNGGTITLVGMAPVPEINYNFAKIMAKEAQIKSVFRYRNVYPLAIEAISSGRINVEQIITNEFDFADIQEAFTRSVSDKNNIVKSVIKITDNDID